MKGTRVPAEARDRGGKTAADAPCDGSAALWANYAATLFQVDSPQLNATIRVGERHAELDRMLRSAGKTRWCFITAWNPGSAALLIDENRARNEALRAGLGEAGLILVGRGIPKDPGWTPEESFLALGIERDRAIALGRAHGQNAVVWGEVGGAAELLDCRDPELCSRRRTDDSAR